MNDKYGNLIKVGSLVKVVEIEDSVFESLSFEETIKVKSMLNEVFEVYEIDEYERAWVEKWWNMDTDQMESHSLGLASYEIMLVNNDS